jgi:hypothetical protein
VAGVVLAVSTPLVTRDHEVTRQLAELEVVSHELTRRVEGLEKVTDNTAQKVAELHARLTVTGTGKKHNFVDVPLE